MTEWRDPDTDEPITLHQWENLGRNARVRLDQRIEELNMALKSAAKLGVAADLLVLSVDDTVQELDLSPLEPKVVARLPRTRRGAKYQQVMLSPTAKGA